MNIVGNYRVEKMIAEGGFGRVFQARHVTLNTPACLKRSKENNPAHVELLKQEARLLWKLCDHHSIPHAKDFMMLPDGTGLMVMSYIDGEPLDRLILPHAEPGVEETAWVVERLLSALYYCHYHGVIHGDIKPGNIMVERRKHDIKLIDFGLAAHRPGSGSAPMGYTELYSAPELKEGKPPIPETDLYGAGMVLLCMLGGDPFTKLVPDGVPEPMAAFCEALLRKNPMERPSWEKTDLIGKWSDIRLEVFGRRHGVGRAKKPVKKAIT